MEQPSPLRKLLERRLTETNTSACLVLRGAEEWLAYGRVDEAVHLMSVTKFVVTLAAARAAELGFVGWNTPVCRSFPEWRQGRKQAVTVRHLLGHVSGLQNVPDARQEIYPAPDFVKLALAAELEAEPGTVFAYNNKAMNLVPALLERATQQPFEHFVRWALLPEEEFRWAKDAAGNAQGMAGLELSARGLARLGCLIAPDRAGGLLSKETLDELLAVPREPYRGYSLWPIREGGQVIGWQANGYLGQWLVVFPPTGLVGVRLVRADHHRSSDDDFPDFLRLMQGIHKELFAE